MPDPRGAAARPASRLLLRRLAARLFDLGVLLAGLLLLPWPLRAVGVAADSVPALALLLAVLAWWAYEASLVARWGATVGKRLAGVRVVDADGRPPRLAAAATRAAPVLLLGVPLLWMLGLAAWLSALVVPDGRGLHDRLAGTHPAPAPWRPDQAA